MAPWLVLVQVVEEGDDPVAKEQESGLPEGAGALSVLNKSEWVVDVPSRDSAIDPFEGWPTLSKTDTNHYIGADAYRNLSQRQESIFWENKLI